MQTRGAASTFGRCLREARVGQESEISLWIRLHGPQTFLAHCTSCDVKIWKGLTFHLFFWPRREEENISVWSHVMIMQ